MRHSLERFPTLGALLDDLVRFTIEETLRRQGDYDSHEKKNLTTITMSWHGKSYQLVGDCQKEVVRHLLHALVESDNPNVDESTLLSLTRTGAGSSSSSTRLADVFSGSPAWGSLIVHGDQPATYRLAEEEPHYQHYQ